MLHSQPVAERPADTLADPDTAAPPFWSGAAEHALSEQQVRHILSAAESSMLEFKRVSGKMVGKALETMCAFANCQGGTLILGVADPASASGPSRLYGIEENAEAVDELRRKAVTSFDPPLAAVCWLVSPVVGREDKHVHLMIVQVPRSEHVHSLVGDGTWRRLGASNCQMTAREITELAYRRGDRSAENEPMQLASDLLDTATWRSYAAARGLSSGSILEQLKRVGLARYESGRLEPTRAATLLFAEEPGGHLAARGARCEIRLLVYKGDRVESRATPNFRKPPKTFRGPLIELIDTAVRGIGDELAEGVALASSGFETVHRIPMRVVKEAIVNAVIHRDYRLNRDIFVRLFDNRIEIESPGALPGTVTVANIGHVGSRTRNPLIARTLRDFPVRPNVDAGEGVRMMFDEMAQRSLYPPLYRESELAAGSVVTVVLMRDSKPPLWDAVSEWIDRNGPIGNAVVCRLGGLKTVKASRMLKRWTDLGLLQVVGAGDRRYRSYHKQVKTQHVSSFSLIAENESSET